MDGDAEMAGSLGTMETGVMEADLVVSQVEITLSMVEVGVEAI